MDSGATLPRLPNAQADSSTDRLREVRDFHYGRSNRRDGRDFDLESLQPAVILASGAEGSSTGTGDPCSALSSMLAVARDILPGRRKVFAEDIERLRDGLRSLLTIEDNRDPSAEGLRNAVGTFGSDLMDTSVLADVLGRQRGSLRVDARRRQRIERALEVLEGLKATSCDTPLLTVVHEAGDRDAIPADADLREIEADDPCRAAALGFDREAEHWSEVFRAVRTARLEIAAAYDPARHDPWLEMLDWEGFTFEELSLVPKFVALEATARLGAERMASLSYLLRSGRPVHTIAITAPREGRSASAEELFSSYHLELAFLGIGHREAFVQQSSTARREHLEVGYARSLGGTRSALHVIAIETSVAAISGRAHPLFRYDPEAGGTWARRLDFTGNPDLEADWPVAMLACNGANGSPQELPLRFTFADYALLDPGFSGEFLPLSDAFRSDDLVPVADFLDLDVEATARRVPFVWAVDPDRDMHRLALTRRLVQACRDRLAFWRTLQELAGVHNEYVQQAVEHVREEVRHDRDALEAERARELESARNEAVSQAMQRLAANLVDLGPDDFAAVACATPALPAAMPVPDEPPAPGEAQGDAEPAVSAEPWIQTQLCTSCNDCRDINPQVFVYDGNKQAKIGDPRAGTYAQLVKAAEKCPARCIHPGLPLDPGEPGASALIARAEPFNR